MHFLIVELKLHGDTAVTDGLFKHGVFENGSNFIALEGQKPPAVQLAPESAERL